MSPRRLLLIVALPSLALALALTVVSAYIPVVLREFTGSAALIGVLLAAEGLCALVLPAISGTMSDRRGEGVRGRLVFLVFAGPLAAVALLGLALSSSLPLLLVALLIFYSGYFTYYAPYLALYPDLFPSDAQGRAQSANALARQAGVAAALIGGGLLFAVSRSLPFAVAAAAIAAATVLLVVKLRGVEHPATSAASGAGVAELLRTRPDLRLLTIANGLWELTLAVIKTFGILFVVAGLGRSVAFGSLLMALVAVGVVVAAVVVGPLADRHGDMAVLRPAVWLYGIGLLVPVAVSSPLLIAAAAPVFAFGAGAVMTLGYTAMSRRMPADARGAASGLFAVGRGIGLLLGPLLAGAAVDLSAPFLSDTHGYAAIWLVASAAVLATLPVVRRLPAPA